MDSEANKQEHHKTVVGLNFKGEQEKFPQIWVNKISGETFVVTPWFQIITGEELIAAMMDKTRYAIGSLAQVGWLIENGNGVFFGMGLSAEQNFDSLGEL